jgi:hypothetical protein
MNNIASRIRTPVRRQGASRHLLVTLLSFALSVTLTRMFLNLTGFPQLGSGGLHIAHVLWGGLLLFLAALIPLVIANQWAFTLGAALAGTGVGLFIDEVGKFVTAENNYFYPPAAPIIYVFFLLCVLLYLQIRRTPSRDPRAAFYRAFEGMQEVLDRDLDPEERDELIAQLKSAAENTENPNLTRLADSLLQFLLYDRLDLVPARPGLADRLRAGLERLEGKWLTRSRFRMALAGAGTGIGAFFLAGLVNVLLAIGTSVRIEQLMSGWILNSFVSSKAALGWFLVRLGLDAAAGSILIAAAILLILGRDRPAINLSIFGLLLILAGVNLLEFYFDQFSEILPATVQLCFLLATLRYRAKFSVAQPVAAFVAPPPIAKARSVRPASPKNRTSRRSTAGSRKGAKSGRKS